MADESTTSSVRVPAVDKEEYSKLCAGVNAIAQPLAGRRTAKKIYKVLQVAMKEKNETMRQGLAEVMKGLRKEEKGLVILAGICEERQIPYIYTPSRRHLGLAVGYARPMIVVLLKRKDDYGELYDEIVENANALSVA